jgi:hypothetical protein
VSLSLVLAGCVGGGAEVTAEFHGVGSQVTAVEPGGVLAVIANQTNTDLEMSFSTDGPGHSSEGSGLIPACTINSTTLPATAGDSWMLSVVRADPGAATTQVIELDSSTRPDLAVPPERARRVEITVAADAAAITQNVLIDRDLADDNLGDQPIAGCG